MISLSINIWILFNKRKKTRCSRDVESNLFSFSKFLYFHKDVSLLWLRILSYTFCKIWLSNLGNPLVNGKALFQAISIYIYIYIYIFFYVKSNFIKKNQNYYKVYRHRVFASYHSWVLFYWCLFYFTFFCQILSCCNSKLESLRNQVRTCIQITTCYFVRHI